MPRGNVILIDALATLLIALVLEVIVISYSTGEAVAAITGGIEKERVRSEFYRVLLQNGSIGIKETEGENALTNVLVMSESPPANQAYVKFFFSDQRGVRQYYVYIKA
jgi:hypothetical protein